MGGGKYYTESGVSIPVPLPKEMRAAFERGGFLSELTQKYLLEHQGMDVTIADIQKNGTAFYVRTPPMTRDEMMNQALAVAMKKLDVGLGARSAES